MLTRRNVHHCLVASIAAPGLLMSNAARAATLTDVQRRALSGGGVVLMLRHAATVSGVGDPPGYRLDDCRTQRNLSDAGRAQSRRLGERWRTLGPAPTAVRSSAWCRCQDTARLAFGTAETWPALNSFFDDRSREGAQTAVLRQALATLAGRVGAFEVWVTHQVNVVALAAESVSMGQGLLLRAGSGGRVDNLGRLDFES